MRLRRQAVEVDFDGGTLTSDAGLLLLREVDRRINLISRIDKLIADPRDLRYVKHSQVEMLTSRIFAIAAGYEDVNDHQQLRHDAAFQVAAGRTPAENNYDETQGPLASCPTISRLENRVDAKTCLQLSELFVDIFLESYSTPPEESFWILMRPMIRFMANKSVVTSMVSTMATASCRCTYSVAISC